jgi:epoxyqueuosine reductase
VEKGGVFLKDAAVLAGLGVVGVNNMLLVPRYGPNLRFRALLINASLPAAAKPDYSPCDGCDRPCLNICPEGALAEGTFNREACLRHMAKDGAGELVMDVSSVKVKDSFGFCRKCELVCPLSGQNG